MLDRLKAEWSAISKAPFTIVTVAAAVFILCFGVFGFVYQYTMNIKDAKIQLLETQIATLKQQTTTSRSPQDSSLTSETVDSSTSQIDTDQAIKDVSAFRNRIQTIRDSMNSTAYRFSQDELHSLRTDYQRSVRPYIEALEMTDPREKDWHGYTLKYDNPVDLAMKNVTFFHLNLSLEFLSRMIGRLQSMESQPYNAGLKQDR